MLSKFKILTKMLIVNLWLVLTGLVIFIIIIATQIYNISSKDMYELMALKSQEISQIATNMLNVPMNVAKTLSNALSVSILQNNPLKPNEIENLLIQTLNSYPALVGA